ncbi:hypothetical protein SO802_011526 [Lithocarpus litseifolius]|uniref:RNase H type-1 domain-containing protein n=1 Tax=Lithocarpus litseifolius TaxID=425828 RepID=A0AAW2D3N7_9ROSI
MGSNEERDGHLYKGCRWLVTKNSNLNIWHNNWTNGGPLRKLIQGPISQEANRLKVKDIMLDVGWDWEKLTFELPDEVKGLIRAIPTSTLGGGSDKLAWAGSPNGLFDVKSAYGITMESSNTSSFLASWIWKADLLPKIRMFLWLCAHSSIGVKVCLEKRGVVQDEVCPVCCNGVLTILHALRHYTHLKQVWNQLGFTASNFDFWHYNLLDWLSLNVRSNDKLHDMGLPWKIVFPFALWNIWKSRNELVFNRKGRSPILAVDVVYQAEYLHCVATPRMQTRRVIRCIRWERPEQGWKKLNTDGSCIGLHSLAGCGGLVRNANGQWVVGFSKRIGVTSSFAIELWGLREGLKLCCNLNIHCLGVEMDAKSIVDVLGNPDYVTNIISTILDGCKQLITRFHQVCIKHCF